MRLFELFDRPPALRELTPSECSARFSITPTVAFEYQNDEGRYVFMFEDVDHTGEWAFSFGRVRTVVRRIASLDDEDVSYELTNEQRPYPILAAAVEVIRRVLAEHHPAAIAFVGHNDRQDKLYSAMVKMLGNRLPAQYEILSGNHDDFFRGWKIKDVDY